MTLAEFVLLFKADTKGLTEGLSGTRKSIALTGEFIKKNREVLTEMGRGAAIAGGVLTGSLALGVFAASKFHRQMAFVSTMVQDTDRFMGQFSDTLKDLSVRYGESTETLSRGLYDILSAGIPAEKALAFLTTSVEAARGGFTSTAIAADALTTVVNAFGYAAEDVNKVSDIMFKTVEKGKLTYADLSSSLGLVVTSAATAGVQFEEVAGSIARLTTVGLSAEMAATALNGALLAIKTPGEAAKKAALDLGIAFDAAALKERGFLGVMEQVIAAAPTEEQLGRLFPDRRARRAIDAIRGDLDRFRRDVTSIYGAAGAAGSAFAKATDDVRFKLDQMKQAGIRLLVEMGEPLLDIVKSLAGRVKDLADRFAKMSPQMKDMIVKGTALAGILLTVAGGALLLIARLPKIAEGLLLVRNGFAGLFKFLSAHPLVLIAVGLGLVAKKLIEVATAAKHAQAETMEMASLQVGAFGKASDILETTAKKIEALWFKQAEAAKLSGREQQKALIELGEVAINLWEAISGERVRTSEEAFIKIREHYNSILPAIENQKKKQQEMMAEVERTEEATRKLREEQEKNQKQMVAFAGLAVEKIGLLPKKTLPELRRALQLVQDTWTAWGTGQISLTEEQQDALTSLGETITKEIGDRSEAAAAKAQEAFTRWMQFYASAIRAGMEAAKEAQDAELDRIKERKEATIESDYETQRTVIANADLAMEEKQKQLEALVEAERKAKDAVVFTDEEMARSRKVGAKAMLGATIDRVLSEVAASAIGAIADATFKGPMTFGVSLLAIPAIIAGEMAFKALLRGLFGSFEKGGLVPVTGPYMLHKGEMIVPAQAAAGVSVNVNIGPVALASDLDVQNVANRVGQIVAEKIRRKRRF